jgi:hypothetical protein
MNELCFLIRRSRRTSFPHTRHQHISCSKLALHNFILTRINSLLLRQPLFATSSQKILRRQSLNMPSESPHGQFPGPSDLQLGGLLCLMGRKDNEKLRCKWAGLRSPCKEDCELKPKGFEHPAIIIEIRKHHQKDKGYLEITFVQVRSSTK